MKNETRPYVMTRRAEKAEATRTRISASAAELYRERAIEDFTLEEVAQRAGTTVQTILRAFGSKEKLVYAGLAMLAERGTTAKPTPPGDVAATVSATFDIYESIGDLVIRRLADEMRRPGLKPSLDEGRKNHRGEVRAAFAPQLARVEGAERAQLLETLCLATDVYVWKILRRDRKLSRRASEAIMRRIVEGVVETEGSDEQDSLVELVGRRQSAP